MVFRDIKKRATAHYQCVPKRHIRNIAKLDLKIVIDSDNSGQKSTQSTDLKLLLQMRRVANAFIK